MKLSADGQKLIIAGIALALIATGVDSFSAIFNSQSRDIAAAPSREEKINAALSEFQSLKHTYGSIANFFAALAKEQGAELAFDVMKRADFPPSVIDLHLLGHLVGDELYYQEGIEGMRICTEDFRNACSHSIVIRAFLDHGEDALKDIYQACGKAPGGKGAYTMCFHGLGHGILAYKDYEFFDAVDICGRLGTPEHRGRESPECVGGVVMEMVDGVHDRDEWRQKSSAFFKKDEPLFPCSDGRIPEKARSMCYIYLTPYLFRIAGLDHVSPGNKELARAMSYCKAIPEHETASRDACFGGFGKEFIGFVQFRDVRLRSLANMNEKQMQQIFDWCMLINEDGGRSSCIRHALASLFWGGENERSIAIRFCNQIGSTKYQDICFNDLISLVPAYIEDVGYRKNFCEEIPSSFQQQCTKSIPY